VGERLPRERVVISEGEVAEVMTLQAFGAAERPEWKAREMERDAPAAILYTSGTTGRQKGAVLSHGNIISNLFTVNRYLRMEPADRILITTPLFHVAAQNVMMNAGLNAAATLVLHRRFDVERCAAAIEEHQVTFMSGVPTIYIALLNAGVSPETLGSVRLFQSAAATMPVEIARRWRETYGKTIYEGYGLTETSPAATFNHEYEYRFGSVGTPVDMVEMRVVDPEDRELPPGAWGEVVFRGPNVMLGYWNRPEETAEAMRQGWFHSGDIGYLDEDGYLYLVDRLKDMINYAGFKIWPREVEEVLYQHPDVRECAVAGIPDPLKGETAKAYIILRDGGRATEEELLAYCRGRLAAYKVPRAVAFVAELPKNPAGKVLKRLLREQEAAPKA
jgi:long-chain acyl-CoA synthetase